jgi:hypothetical protein
MARPNLKQLFWVHSSSRPHHMGGSEATTCPEKVAYSKASTVSPDPHGRAPDPWIYSPDPQGWSRTPGYTVQTSEVGLRPPLVQARPLEWDLDPPYGVRAAHRGSQGPKTEHART